MPPMPIADAAFLLAEARERPMHVGGLQLFSFPEGTGPDFLADLYDQTVRQADRSDVHPLFRRRAHRSLTTLGQWGWETDNDLDLEYHVRHSALPNPGRIRELLALVSRMHSTLLDRNRPLWEVSLIEGLEGGQQFAMYTKIHHALLDGVAAARFLQDVLSEDPDERDMAPPWSAPMRKTKRDGGPVKAATSMVSGALHAAGETIGVGQALARSVRDAFREHVTALPFQAPPSMLNVPITGGRRFAADSWELARFRALRKATGATLNDVVMAMCSGALRAYLLEQDALPEQSLVAAVPVSLRTSDAAAEGGNAVGMLLCNLGTDLEDPADRLERVRTSMNQGKERFADLSPGQIVALSAMVMAPLLVGRWAPRPPFNLTISNVPGPRQPMYFNGAHLDGSYPLSIPSDGQALNITCLSYAEHLEFGLTGCRRAVPHLQRLLSHLEDSLAGLEKATG